MEPRSCNPLWSVSKKKGEKVVSYTTFKWIADNNALEQEEYLGESMSKAIHYWDPVSQKIKVLSVDAAGGNGRATIWKQGNKWVWESEGALVDGKKLTGRGTIEVIDEGKVIAYEGKVLLDGKELLPYRDVYTRVSKLAGN